MKLSIIFVSAMLIAGQEAWAKDYPKDLSKSSSPSLVQSPLTHKEQLERSLEIIRLVSDVINGDAAVKPSMVPIETFDRIYFVEKWTQRLMADLEEKIRADQVQGAKGMFYLGQLTAMRDILYIAGVLPEATFSLTKDIPLFPLFPLFPLTENVPLSAGADRMRLITAMLLLLNYKESNPIPPGDIVQVSIIK